MSETLDVPGARLRYEVSGSGPVLLLIPGGPADRGTFDRATPLLAARYTVVRYDPRGLSDSTVEDRAAEITVATQADDAHRLLAQVDGGSAFVFGSSGGAITGLALALAHPDQVRTLVAHEPPITDLLPDREAHRAHNRDVQETFRTQGIGPAMAKFMAGAGFAAPPPEAPAGPPPEMPAGPPSEAPAGPPPGSGGGMPPGMAANLALFLGPMWRALGDYRPDIDALRAGPTRIVVGAGAASAGQFAHRAALLLAEALGTEAVIFPGDHGGIMAQPEAFVPVLRTTLSS